MNRLSQKENKYRIKLIAENHMKKSEQRCLDDYVNNNLIDYSYLYKQEKAGYSYFAVQLALNNMVKPLSYFKTEVEKLINSFQKNSFYIKSDIPTKGGLQHEKT